MLLEHTCDVTRNTAVGTNGRRQRTALATGVRCLCLPMDARAAIENGFTVGRSAEVFFELDQDVKVGDKLTILGNSYNVRGVAAYEVPLVGHKRALCEQENV